MGHLYTNKQRGLLFLLLLILLPCDLLAQEVSFPFNPIFLPPVFDGKFPEQTTSFTLPWDTVQSPVSVLDPEEIYRNRLRKDAKQAFMRNNIPAVKYSQSGFPSEVEQVEEIHPNIFKHLFAVEAEYANAGIDRSARYVPKHNYWIMSGSSLLLFSQNYISKNWMSGGTGNLNLLSAQSLNLNYKKGKLQFNNFLEWKLSFFTNPNDTLRSFRLGEDMVRTYSDFGLKAFNDKWSYSINLEIKTKLLRNYRENTQTRISSILSPLQVNMGILGMKYQHAKTSKKDKDKKINLSVDVSPLSVQYTWVADRLVNPASYGIPEGKHSLLDLGSTLNAKWVQNFNRQITFTSRLKYFTNYEKSILESENELNMALNRYFSTRIYLYARFDDTSLSKRIPDFGYVQLNELLSFGFNYKW